MKLEIVPEEAMDVRRIYDWADAERGSRWIVKALNDDGRTLRGAKFTHGNVAGILSREIYTGTYYDRTADDDGVVPEIEDAIAVSCPVIIEREQYERVAAKRAERNPRQTAPHVAAGTTMLVGLASCGMPDCSSGLTIRTGKSGQYAHYTCNDRVNRGGGCQCPTIRREQLDTIVLQALETKLLAPDRLRTLLSGILDLSDERRKAREEELARARAEHTRLRTAISRLLILVEEGTVGPRDPDFAERMATNRMALAATTSRIDVLEAQLAQGTRRIDEHNEFHNPGIPGVLRGKIIADTEPQLIQDLARHGFSIEAAHKGPGSVDAGIEFLKNYDIYVHPRCQHAITELTLYSYVTDRQTGVITNKLSGTNNHVIDALRYAIEPVRNGGYGELCAMTSGDRREFHAALDRYVDLNRRLPFGHSYGEPIIDMSVGFGVARDPFGFPW